MASELVVAGMAVLPLSVAGLLVAGVARAAGRGASVKVGLALAAWMALGFCLARAGVLARLDVRPPPLLPFVFASAALAAGLARSSLGERLARGLPLWALVASQGFRLPLELVMHRAATEGVMPVQMSFSGYNFDILTGASALLVGGLLRSGRGGRGLAAAWNALGLALLVNVVGIALASTPLLHAFGTDPARLNTWVTAAPFVWLPAVLVPAALLGHLLVWRRLALEARAPAAA